MIIRSLPDVFTPWKRARMVQVARTGDEQGLSVDARHRQIGEQDVDTMLLE